MDTALTGWPCIPKRLGAAGFDFNYPTFAETASHVVGKAA